MKAVIGVARVRSGDGIPLEAHSFFFLFRGEDGVTVFKIRFS